MQNTRPIPAAATAASSGGDSPVLGFGGLTYDPGRRLVHRGGEPIPLGGRTLDLLACLLDRAGQLVDIPTLLQAGWAGRHVQINNLSVQMSALRKALGQTDDGAPFIQTVASRGYRLCVPVTEVHTNAALPWQTAQVGWPAGSATNFIGREAELSALQEAMTKHRLITVTGTGGVGKTRLVTQACLGRASFTVYGVDLAPLTTTFAMIQAMNAAFGDGEVTIDALLARLRSRTVRLVLDNAEHLTTALGVLVHSLLERCPGLWVVVTSRQVLGIAGEYVLRLPPMPVPTQTDMTGPEALSLDCVRLFVDRASSILPGFALHDGNAASVVEICRRLDGIALAIEMVVPRLRAMSPMEISNRLGERFRLLVPAGPDVLPRQRTLRTMLDWSWELLDTAEREALTWLALFSAPATLAAIWALAQGHAQSDWAVLDSLTGLADKSLLTTETAGDGTRYRLLQTTRDYALATLAQGELQTLRRRHAMFMTDVFTSARDAWDATPSPIWLRQYGPAADDLRAALTWATGPGGDGDLAVQLLGASTPLWWDLPGPPLREMRRWFERCGDLLHPATPALHVAWFNIGHAWGHAHFGDTENRPAATRAVAAARETGDPIALGSALLRLGSTLMRAETMAEAGVTFLEAEQHLRRQPPGKFLALLMTRRADVMVRAGAAAESLAAYGEAIDLSRALQFRHGQVTSISNMTEVLFTLGMRDQALEQLYALRDSLQPGPRSPAVATLAAHLAMDNQPAASLQAAEEVVEWAPVAGLVGPLAWAAETVALLVARLKRLTLAAPLAGYARHVLPSVNTRYGSRRAVYLELTAILTAGLSLADRLSLEAAGAAWTVAEAGAALQVACRIAAGLS